MSAMSLEICSVAPLAWAARFFTSLATTANPLPASPARADFDRSVECEQVDLPCDVVDQVDDPAHRLGRRAEAVGGLVCRLDTFDRTVGCVLRSDHGFGDLFHRGIELLGSRRDALHHLPDMLALLSSNDLIGDISGEFDDLKGLSAQVEDRIVGCLDPHLFAVLPDALELCRLKFTAIAARLSESRRQLSSSTSMALSSLPMETSCAQWATHHSIFVDAIEKDSAEYKEFLAALNRGEFQAAEFKRIGKNGKEVWI